jgi:hypothetical protein
MRANRLAVVEDHPVLAVLVDAGRQPGRAHGEGHQRVNATRVRASDRITFLLQKKDPSITGALLQEYRDAGRNGETDNDIDLQGMGSGQARS